MSIDDDPEAPTGVRLVHAADGTSMLASEITYLGPDPEYGVHVFEAWFDVDPRVWSSPPPKVTIERLPGKTSVRIRLRHPRNGYAPAKRTRWWRR